jgi:hypothetical protein
VHANDIVPQLPPQGDVGKLFDFHHPPTEVWYRTGEPYKVARCRTLATLAAPTETRALHFLTPMNDTHVTPLLKVCNAEGEDETCQDSVPFLHLSAADHTWYLNMSTGCSQEEAPLDEAAAAALDDEAWRAVRSNPGLTSLMH